MASPERHVRVRATEFSPERLDTGFYSRAYFDTRAAISRSGLKTESIGSVCEPWQFGAYALCNDIEWSDAASGVPYIKAEALGSPLLNESGLAYVTPSTHRLLEKSQLKPGDIVVSTSGTIGLCAVLPERLNEANSNQDTIKFNPSSAGYDCFFVAAWIASAPGQVFLNREAGGAVQQHVYLYNFKRVPLLKIAAEAQRYIGDKVRQAERLRERARMLEAAVANIHAQFIVPPTGIDFAKRTRRLAARSLTERLDAHFYPSAVEQYFRQLGGPTRSLERLCSLVVNGQSQPEAEEGVRQATVTNLGRSFVEGTLRIVERPADGSRALAPHDLLLCNAAHNKSYIGRDVTYSQVEGPYPSTEVMVVRVDRTQIPASFVRHYLKTAIGYLQVQSTIRGITAHSYPTDVKLLEIPIPAVPDVDREAWFATDDQMLAAGRCFDAARVLASVATTLVEHLIDGRINEADLVAAQKALEAGDRSPDREILKAIQQSDAPDAKPLIADVDALYALLDEPDGQDA
ncbi:hypothetical protein [Roseomonas sp. AR75]|uniref:hypothetical protein n=1 Tax=Roseomonas sp. AR75 TaxID=2562311 RepID=UPI0010BFB40F|nr:hypothetical protein [Roseomonas sp. AR75]